MERVDLVVSGSVAVTEAGHRVGKGEGYSDLEYGLLAGFDRVDDATTTATTVHERQVVDDAPTGAHDVPMDLVVTPARTVRSGGGERPDGIEWDTLSEDRLAELPALARLRDPPE
jgi:5-formyltetrahydrofolate cyclo-ligase